MGRTIYLGYTCPSCCTRVPVYTFTNVNGEITATPPEDQSVECPFCHSSQTVNFGLLQHLDRWERPATAPPSSSEMESAPSGGAHRCREFTRGNGGSAIPLVYKRAQLVKGLNGHIYVVSPDGTTLILSEDAAKELCDKYSEQSTNGAREFSLRLTFHIAAPVDNPGHGLLQSHSPKHRQDAA